MLKILLRCLNLSVIYCVLCICYILIQFTYLLTKTQLLVVCRFRRLLMFLVLLTAFVLWYIQYHVFHYSSHQLSSSVAT